MILYGSDKKMKKMVCRAPIPNKMKDFQQKSSKIIQKV
jgi:hypothetical protein